MSGTTVLTCANAAADDHGERAADDQVLALDPVRKAHREQRPGRQRERDDERVQQALRDGDAPINSVGTQFANP